MEGVGLALAAVLVLALAALLALARQRAPPPSPAPPPRPRVLLSSRTVNGLRMDRFRAAAGGAFGAGEVECGGLRLEEDRRAGTGGSVWPPTLVVATAVPRSLFEGREVLEVGSGLGLLGLLLARGEAPPARLVMTDTERAVPLLERNVARAGPAAAARVSVRPLRWGDDPGGRFDLVLGSDVLYSPQHYDALLRTVRAASPRRVLMAYEERLPADEADFFRRLGGRTRVIARHDKVLVCLTETGKEQSAATLIN